MKLREEEFYEQYHHHGGTTIIPTEIFNELYDDATEEIERLNNIINGLEKDIKNNKVAIGIKKNSNYAIPVEYVLDKLQELKGDDKE